MKYRRLKAGSWFNTFFNEKNLPYVSWDLTDSSGTWHHLDNEVVIEMIKSAPAQEQAAIKDMLIRIDFANGDVNDYLKHLAQGLVENMGSPF